MAEPSEASEFVCGSHHFDIVGYSTIKSLGTGKHIRSSPFNVGGHDWVVQFFPNGRHSYTTGYVSLYVKLLNPTKKVSAIISFSLRTREKGYYVSDQSPLSTTNSNTLLQTFDQDNPIQGVPYFMKKADLSSSKYLSDDCLTVRCILWVCMDSPAPVASVPKPPTVPPSSNLAVHFRQLLESKEGADVKFSLGEKTFSVHKCVLAARSPVFREQFFGPKGDKTADSVVLEGIDAATFQNLLHFIYTDTDADLLPDCNSGETIGSSNKRALVELNQQLLVAADLYKLERLKVLCENRLCEDLTLETVATTLALAEEHNCPQLRAACVEFAAKRENYMALSLTDGFEKLKQSYPTLLKELAQKASP
ncbi:BTB/POZ/MATH-domain protein [Rhynchospora pubera]|uniref:BTB/POZ/MATH-domain protein n=1 Tax=Rhynchospora pubera TaxID=906938 RepID=A0AAV8HAW8_9POAL|nr:BTB/POZ/MATH-domain protein [Rhynchospora pubera]